MFLSEVKLALSMDKKDTIVLVLERFKAPRIIENLLKMLPLNSRILIFKDEGYAYIPLRGSFAGSFRTVKSVNKGMICFTAQYPGIVIILRDNAKVPYPCVPIGYVDEKEISRLLKYKALQVTINIWKDKADGSKII